MRPTKLAPAAADWSGSVARGVRLADSYPGMRGRSLRSGSPGPNPLEQYFDAHTEGPVVWKFRHYFDIYHRHFEKFVGREVHVLEIGVGAGGSMGLWKNYFGPQCKIYGVDIEPQCRSFESESVKIFQGDQADREFWTRFKAEVPTVDIVIDDGSHWPEHQMVTIEELLPHLRSGGVYLCEDVFIEPEFPEPHAFHLFLSGLASRMHVLTKPTSGFTNFHQSVQANPVRACVRGVFFYPQVIVLEMNDEPNTGFEAPMRGTQWLKTPTWLKP